MSKQEPKGTRAKRKVVTPSGSDLVEAARLALMRLYLAGGGNDESVRGGAHDAWCVAQTAIELLGVRAGSAARGDETRRRELVAAWADVLRGVKDVEAIAITGFYAKQIQDVSFTRGGRRLEDRERTVRSGMAEEYLAELKKLGLRELRAPMAAIGDVVDALTAKGRKGRGQGSGTYTTLARVLLLCAHGVIDKKRLAKRSDALRKAANGYSDGLELPDGTPA